MKIQVILGSTRDGRRGGMVANWVNGLAKARTDAEFEFIDLKEWNLPFYNDPKNPSTGEYSFDYTKKWSEKISEGDGYLIITPEYNHGYPAPLKNALDLLYKEWNNKPIAFVSYGGSAGGARAVEQLKQVAVELEMVPLQMGVSLIRFPQFFDEQGNIKDPVMNDRVNKLFDELIKWTENLKVIREKS